MTTTSSPYADYLTRPVWPKKHRTRLDFTYTGSSQADLQAESSTRNRHLPGRESVSRAHGLPRHAGTSGRVYGNTAHPDDFDETVQDVLDGLQEQGEDHQQPVVDNDDDDERKELLKTIQDASHPEQVRADFMKLFKDPRIVISAREAKELTPNFGFELENAAKHGHARYSLLISESELKNQDWPGKRKDEADKEAKEKKDKQEQNEEGSNAIENSKGQSEQQDQQTDSKGNDKTDDNSSKKGGVSATDQKVNREQDDEVEQGDPVENLTPEQRRFFDALVQEAKQITAFKNSSGKPVAPEKDEDESGTAQVGFEIQMDDQFTPDVRSPIQRKRLTWESDECSGILAELDTSLESPQASDRQASAERRAGPARAVRLGYGDADQAPLCAEPRICAQASVGDALSRGFLRPALLTTGRALLQHGRARGPAERLHRARAGCDDRMRRQPARGGQHDQAE